MSMFTSSLAEFARSKFKLTHYRNVLSAQQADPPCGAP
jgi:hypothetical protein